MPQQRIAIGHVVTENGAALHPDYLTRRFHHLVGESGLPPIRLHDLRR